ncbi:MAG: DinB family protein [Nocardioides sp.]
MTVSRTDPPLAVSEAETLRAFLDYHRDTLLMKADGLTQEQLSQAHPPSELTLGGLLKHAALNDDWWFSRVFGGRETEPDWVPEGAFDEDADWELHSAEDDTPEELRRIFDSARADADAAIDRGLAADGLDAPSAVTSRREDGKPFSLRWVILHMIEEYARHNGHADLLREAVDGQVGE